MSGNRLFTLILLKTESSVYQAPVRGCELYIPQPEN